MPEYKLSYFNMRGRAEIIRYLFALAEVEYEDVRIELQDWPSKKDGMNIPFGQMPILSIDGVVYAQSFPIARYLAEKFGYAGKTDLDKLRADMIVHYCEDFVKPLVKICWEQDEKKKIEFREQYIQNAELNSYLANFEKTLNQNNGGDGFFVGDSITWADVTVYQYLSFVKTHGEIDITPHLASFPKLEALVQRVAQVPQIAAWISKRPETNI